LEVRTKHRKH